METRIDAFWTEIQPLIETGIQQQKQTMMALIDEQKDNLITDLEITISNGLKQTRLAQEQGKKGSLSYVVISFLNTDFMNRQYQVQIDFYDHRLYLDLEDCSVLYSYVAMADFFEESVMATCQAVNKLLVRMTSFEMEEIRFRFRDNLSVCVRESILLGLQDDRLLSSFFTKVSRLKPVSILYGYHFNDQQLCLQIN